MEYKIISYDVWGNPKDGFEVNDNYDTGITLELLENSSDYTVISELKKAGFLKKTAKNTKFEVDGDFSHSLYIDHVTQRRGSYPFCELRAMT